MRCGCNEHQTENFRFPFHPLQPLVNFRFFAFRNPITIVFYVVILDIYKTYNFVAILTAFSFVSSLYRCLRSLILNMLYLSLYYLFLWLSRSAVLFYSSHFLCYIHTAFSYHIAIALYYTAFLSLITRQIEVWSSILVLCNQSTNRLFTISRL